MMQKEFIFILKQAERDPVSLGYIFYIFFKPTAISRYFLFIFATPSKSAFWLNMKSVIRE